MCGTSAKAADSGVQRWLSGAQSFVQKKFAIKSIAPRKECSEVLFLLCCTVKNDSGHALRKIKFFGGQKPLKQVPAVVSPIFDSCISILLKSIDARAFTAFGPPKNKIFRRGCSMRILGGIH
jgi:hypothetical protein